MAVEAHISRECSSHSGPKQRLAPGWRLSANGRERRPLFGQHSASTRPWQQSRTNQLAAWHTRALTDITFPVVSHLSVRHFGLPYLQQLVPNG
jgi:hypothetical protein